MKMSFDGSLTGFIHSNRYIYDELNQLKSVSLKGMTIYYQYDENGNLLQRTVSN